MVNGLIVFVALVFAVISHEFGHMIMTKLCGVPVPEFGLGFGKKLGSFTFNGTNYRVGLIPLGGYVKPDNDAFYKLPAYKKNLVYLAGPLVNIFSAALLLWAYWMSVGINMGHSIDSLVFKAWNATISTMSLVVTTMVPAIQDMGANALMGPVGAIGVAVMSPDPAGWFLVLIIALIMFSLGLFNLLPIPALDGGQVLMTTLRIPAAIYNKVTQTAMYALLSVGVVIMIWDLYRIANGTIIGV